MTMSNRIVLNDRLVASRLWHWTPDIQSELAGYVTKKL